MNVLPGVEKRWLSVATIMAAALSLVLAACTGAATPPTTPPSTGNTPSGQQTGTATSSTGAINPCPQKGVTELTGGGATFPFPLYSKMFDEYNKLCNVKVNYQ